jgi:chromosome segregation ATPase
MTIEEFNKLKPKQQEAIEKERALKYEEHLKLSEYRVLCKELEKQHHEALRQLALANQRVDDLKETLAIMGSRERTLLEQLARCPDPK